MHDQKAPSDLFNQYNIDSLIKKNPTDWPYFILAWNRKHIIKMLLPKLWMIQSMIQLYITFILNAGVR